MEEETYGLKKETTNSLFNSEMNPDYMNIIYYPQSRHRPRSDLTLKIFLIAKKVKLCTNLCLCPILLQKTRVNLMKI